MKPNSLFRASVAFFWLLLFTANGALAQTIVTHTPVESNSDGIISELRAETILIRSEASPFPVSYNFGREFLYVDETGAPIPFATVRLGQPVTVFFSKVGDKLVASKVIVRKVAIVPVFPTTGAPSK